MSHRYSPSRRQFLGASGGLLLASGGIRAARSQAPKDVTITMSSNSFSIAVLRIAEQRGFYAKHGLNVRLVVSDSASAAFAAMISGSAQLCSAGILEAVAAITRGQDVFAVSNIYRGTSCMIVLAKNIAEKSGVKPDAPVTERLKVLDGLTFAGPSPTSGFTTSADLSVRSVGGKMKITHMAQPAMAAALESGAVQVMAAGTPFWAPPVTRGFGVAWIRVSAGELPEEFVPSTSGTLLMTKAYARANPDVIKGIQDVAQEVATTSPRTRRACSRTSRRSIPISSRKPSRSRLPMSGRTGPGPRPRRPMCATTSTSPSSWGRNSPGSTPSIQSRW